MQNTQTLIDFVQANINTAKYGACCFGIVRRRTGEDLLAVYWPYLDKANPKIAALWASAESLVDEKTATRLADRTMRQRFCLPQDWAKYLQLRRADQTLAPPPWEGPQRNCHFYPLSAFGLTWDDFALYRALPRPPKPEKPWRPLKQRSPKEQLLMPILLAPEEIAKLTAQYPDTPIPTILWNLVSTALHNTSRESLEIAGMTHTHTLVAGGRKRFNIYVPIEMDEMLRSYANANHVPIAAIIRSIIHGHPHWKCQQVLDKVS